MRLLKSNSLLSLVNSYVVDSPQPANLSYAWNFGSLLALCLGIQIATGVLLAMHYTPNVDLRFISVEHIMRDVNYGWMIRYIHANVASFFFIFVYLHVARGLYYGSYKSPRVLLWSIGVIILVLMMRIAFLGFFYGQTWFTISNFDFDFDYMTLTPYSIASSRLKAILDKHNLKPVFIWEDLSISGIKEIISQALKNVCGIYAIINLVNGEMYVGSAVFGNIYNRFHRHLFGGSGNARVFEAGKEYGLNNFAFVVLERMGEETDSVDNVDLLERENDYFLLLKPTYNFAPIAGNTFGYKHTDAAKQAMRDNYSQERRDTIGALNRGKTLSPETREKIRLAALSRGPMSDETRAKVIRNSANVKLFDVARVDGALFLSEKDGMVRSTIVRSIPSVADITKCNERTVRRALAADGIIKKTWTVKDLGLANSKS